MDGPVAGIAEAVISIKPIFAAAILSGEKSVELRRRIPPIPPGIRLWIYATRPLAAVVGSAVVKRIVRGSPNDLWKKIGSGAGVDREAYDAYFLGASEAVGLILSDVQRGRPISLEELRRIRADFQPPQVIARISTSEALSFHDLTTVDRSILAPRDRRRKM
jgi:predicted transcriptional regulator